MRPLIPRGVFCFSFPTVLRWVSSPEPSSSFTKRRLQMLNIAEAEKLIVAEWREWSNQHGSYSTIAMQKFYWEWLPKHKPKLLSFRCKGDKWQIVHGWLQRHEDSQSRLQSHQS